MGIADGISERFYAVSAQRRLKHPLVNAILEHAQKGLFGLLNV
jgi:LysR family transcriptional activator of nhaA